MKVWLVGSGEYSDYSVDAIFSTKELADAYAAERRKMGWYSTPNDPDEWDLDAEVGVKAFTGWFATIDLSTGTITQLREHNWIGREAHQVTDIGSHTRSAWSSKSEEHAVKLVVEARQAWLREQLEVA